MKFAKCSWAIDSIGMGIKLPMYVRILFELYGHNLVIHLTKKALSLKISQVTIPFIILPGWSSGLACQFQLSAEKGKMPLPRIRS